MSTRPLFAFGDLVLDVVARVEGKLEPDTDTAGEVRTAPGGSAANFAAWTARLGDAVRFACRVGDDMLGRALVEDLRLEGVEPYPVYDRDRPTATLLLFAEGSQRHMLVPSGANHFLDADDIPAEAVQSAGWLHVTGYSFFWEATARGAERALSLARAQGLPISFDPSSAGFIRRHGLAVPAGTQLLIPNLEEAQVLAGCEAPEEAARRLGEQVPLVAMKLGPEGALLCERGVVTRVPLTEPLDGPVLDTTGAGDAWGATFVSALRRGRGAVAAAQAANRLAGRVVTRLGARPIMNILPT